MDNPLRQHLSTLYDAQTADDAYEQLMVLIDSYRGRINAQDSAVPFSERDIVLITYGDTLKHPGQTPLQSLRSFATRYLKGVISTIHILPFYPYSSDDGFSVLDFYAVNPELGTWEDVEALGKDFALMFDAVFNHMSAQSEWFRRWLAGEPEYAGLFRTESPNANLSSVTRPRALPLLTPFERPNGETVYVWTTFSDDQVDFDISTPRTLLRLLEILLFYVEKGARVIRLDAIAFLWKQAGTTSIHLPQTHAAIKLMRAVLNAVAPQVILITETNVPHAENIAYFGDGTDEAQMVYNFTLPPLLFHTLLSGDATKLRRWIATLETPSDCTTFFNFTASHDGIGVRPVEGILDHGELQAMIAHVESVGGRVSYRQNPDGSQSPYELNVTYVDAIAGMNAPQSIQVARFLLSQTIQMTLAGVPAVYIHSLLGSRNDLAGMVETGRSRSINRARLDQTGIEAKLADETSFRAQVFHEYLRRLQLRAQQPAFHPNATQTAIDLGNPALFGILRTAQDNSQMIMAVFNVSNQPQPINLGAWLSSPAADLLTDTQYHPQFVLDSDQAVWLEV